MTHNNINIEHQPDQANPDPTDIHTPNGAWHWIINLPNGTQASGWETTKTKATNAANKANALHGVGGQTSP